MKGVNISDEDMQHVTTRGLSKAQAITEGTELYGDTPCVKCGNMARAVNDGKCIVCKRLTIRRCNLQSCAKESKKHGFNPDIRRAIEIRKEKIDMDNDYYGDL